MAALDRQLDVLGMVVAAADDDQIPQAAGGIDGHRDVRGGETDDKRHVCTGGGCDAVLADRVDVREVGLLVGGPEIAKQVEDLVERFVKVLRHFFRFRRRRLRCVGGRVIGLGDGRRFVGHRGGRCSVGRRRGCLPDFRLRTSLRL